jgi:hypothetical protein
MLRVIYQDLRHTRIKFYLDRSLSSTGALRIKPQKHGHFEGKMPGFSSMDDSQNSTAGK